LRRIVQERELKICRIFRAAKKLSKYRTRVSFVHCVNGDHTVVGDEEIPND
jgi:hypothetical protein